MKIKEFFKNINDGELEGITFKNQLACSTIKMNKVYSLIDAENQKYKGFFRLIVFILFLISTIFLISTFNGLATTVVENIADLPVIEVKNGQLNAERYYKTYHALENFSVVIDTKVGSLIELKEKNEKGELTKEEQKVLDQKNAFIILKDSMLVKERNRIEEIARFSKSDLQQEHKVDLNNVIKTGAKGVMVAVSIMLSIFVFIAIQFVNIIVFRGITRIVLLVLKGFKKINLSKIELEQVLRYSGVIPYTIYLVAITALLSAELTETTPEIFKNTRIILIFAILLIQVIIAVYMALVTKCERTKEEEKEEVEKFEK